MEKGRMTNDNDDFLVYLQNIACFEFDHAIAKKINMDFGSHSDDN